MNIKEWAKVQESLLKSQLKIIREVLRQDSPPRFKSQSKGRSQTSTAHDVLHAAGKPLHVSKIISRAREDFNVELDRDSIVSALTKKVKAGRTFKLGCRFHHQGHPCSQQNTCRRLFSTFYSGARSTTLHQEPYSKGIGTGEL